MPFYVHIKHGEVERHDGLVSALEDILDVYVNARTGITVWKDEEPPEGAILWFPTHNVRRIRGPY